MSTHTSGQTLSARISSHGDDAQEASAEASRTAATEVRTACIGVGLLSGTCAAFAVGIADGAIVLLRGTRGSLSASAALLVWTQAAAILGALGLLLGPLQELFLAAACRRPALVGCARWLGGGPPRWFARDPDRAVAVLLTASFAGLALGPLWPVASRVFATFHSPTLAAAAVLLCALSSVAVSTIATVILSWPLEAVVRRMGRLASPGAAGAIVLFTLACLAVRELRVRADLYRSLDMSPLACCVCGAVADVLVAVTSLRSGRGPRRAAVSVALASLVVALLGSAYTLASNRATTSTLLLRSVTAGPVARFARRTLIHDRRPHETEPSTDLGDGYMVVPKGVRPGALPSFLFLSIDAMRPDHVGAYGYTRPTTPNLDRFAKGAAVFMHAYCTSPRSLRSFASIWTGHYPSLIAWGSDNRFPELLPTNATLASLLARKGYASAAFNDADYFTHTPGLLAGFSHVREAPTDVWKGDVTAEVADALHYLREHEGDAYPFFVWVHMMEPHDPYRAWDGRNFGSEPVDTYDEEIARADDAAKPLLDFAASIAQKRALFVFVFSDHGEAFGEHGFHFHSSDLHEEQAKVALLARGPGIPPGERRSLVSLMDLFPTLLNYAGLRAPSPIDGRSLVGALEDPSAPFVGSGWRDHLFLEVTPDGVIPNEQKGLLEPPWKLIYDVRRDVIQLHDLATDPGEKRNVFADEPARSSALWGKLRGWVDGATLASNRRSELISAARLKLLPEHVGSRLETRLGDVAILAGFDLLTPIVKRGETFRASLYLKVLRRTEAPYWFRLSFVPDDGGSTDEWFDAPHFPVHGHYPTTRWQPGELVRDDVEMRVVAEARPTGYSVRLRVEEDGTDRLATPDVGGLPDGSVVLGHIDVAP